MRFIFAFLIGMQVFMLVGCVPQAAPKAGGPKIQGVLGEGPISDLDIPTLEQKLSADLTLPADKERPLKIAKTAHTKKVSYVLYKMLNNDGLAIVTKQGANVKILERIPILEGDPNRNLVTFNTIVAGNPWDPDNGVLFGTVHNQHIKQVEASFRDATKVTQDVSQSRGFIIIRPGTDTRFVQIRAYSEGGLFWTQDTR